MDGAFCGGVSTPAPAPGRPGRHRTVSAAYSTFPEGPPDPWVVLDLPRHADKTQLKARFMHLVKTEHPDKMPGNEERFKDITAAYRELADMADVREWDGEGGSHRIHEYEDIDPHGPAEEGSAEDLAQKGWQQFLRSQQENVDTFNEAVEEPHMKAWRDEAERKAERQQIKERLAKPYEGTAFDKERLRGLNPIETKRMKDFEKMHGVVDSESEEKMNRFQAMWQRAKLEKQMRDSSEHDDEEVELLESEELLENEEIRFYNKAASKESASEPDTKRPAEIKAEKDRLHALRDSEKDARASRMERLYEEAEARMKLDEDEVVRL